MFAKVICKKARCRPKRNQYHSRYVTIPIYFFNHFTIRKLTKGLNGGVILENDEELWSPLLTTWLETLGCRCFIYGELFWQGFTISSYTYLDKHRWKFIEEYYRSPQLNQKLPTASVYMNDLLIMQLIVVSESTIVMRVVDGAVQVAHGRDASGPGSGLRGRRRPSRQSRSACSSKCNARPP